MPRLAPFRPIPPPIVQTQEFDELSEIHRPDGLVSTLLEELLHAQVYGVRWQHHGNFFLEDANADIDFKVIASRIHDEYVVSRAKNELSSSLPLFDAPGMPGYRVQRIFSFDGDLEVILSRARREVESLPQLVQLGRVTISEMESRLVMGTVFRSILDPLSRSFGFFDGMPVADQQQCDLILPNSDFLKTYVRPHWQQMHLHLQESYASGLKESLRVIDRIAVEIQRLIQKLETQMQISPSD